MDDDERRRLVGRRIAEARRAKGLSQAALAHAFGEGFQTMNVSRWESGKHMPQGGHLHVLARVLGRTADWLLAIEQPEQDEGGAGAADADALPAEVLALCDAMAVPRPSAEEARWLLAEPQFHRRSAIAVVIALGACGPRVYVSSARYETPQDRGEFAGGAVYGAGAPTPSRVPLAPDDGVYAQFAADIASVQQGCPRQSVIPTHREMGPAPRGRRAYWLSVCGRPRLYVLTDDGWAPIGPPRR